MSLKSAGEFFICVCGEGAHVGRNYFHVFTVQFSILCTNSAVTHTQNLKQSGKKKHQKDVKIIPTNMGPHICSKSK